MREIAIHGDLTRDFFPLCQHSLGKSCTKFLGFWVIWTFQRILKTELGKKMFHRMESYSLKGTWCQSYDWLKIIGLQRAVVVQSLSRIQLFAISWIAADQASLCRRQWHPTPVFLPGKSHGRRSLVGSSPWGRWVGHDWATSLSLFTFMHWRRKWQPTPVFLPGESQGQRSLVGCRLWGRTESDMTEAT